MIFTYPAEQYITHKKLESIMLGKETMNIEELLAAAEQIEILFSDQKYTNKFIHVISKIETYNDIISALYRKNHNTISEEDFDEYKKKYGRNNGSPSL